MKMKPGTAHILVNRNREDLIDEIKRPDNRRAGLKLSAVEIIKDAKNLKTQSKHDKA